MSHIPPSPLEIPADFPGNWRDALGSQLKVDERVLAYLPLDLDGRLHFAPGMLVATTERLLATANAQSGWQSWNYCSGLILQRHDHAGVGTLALDNAQGRLASWHYTLAHNGAAQRVMAQFALQMAAMQGVADSLHSPAAVCVNWQDFRGPTISPFSRTLR